MGKEDFIDQILTSLKVISMIKEGQKVRVRNGLLDLEMQSTGMRAAIRRWVHNDNRQNTILYIKNVVGHAIEISQIRHSSKIENALTETLAGLSALGVTYGDDMGTVASISVLQLRIKSELEDEATPLKKITHSRNNNNGP